MTVLCYKQNTYQTAIFTKAFFKLPSEAFVTQEDCEKWIYKLL